MTHLDGFVIHLQHLQPVVVGTYTESLQGSPGRPETPQKSAQVTYLPVDSEGMVSPDAVEVGLRFRASGGGYCRWGIY